MTYKQLRDTWAVQEEYAPRITMSYPAWRQYVGSGLNYLHGGAIIPDPGTEQTGFGDSGAVYKGTVHQNWNGWTS